MRASAERTYFALCLVLGHLLRSARYATALIPADERHVQKRRLFYAPLVIWMGGLLLGVLNTGIRVLPRRKWHQRERSMYERLYGASIRIDSDGMLTLPFLPGETLAALLDRELDDSIRKRAIELAAVALVEFHARGLTHGDAMAENVMIDLDAGVARWFDFETVHDSRRPMTWRRADDVRALLATCLLRTAPDQCAETARFVFDVYGDDEVAHMFALHCSTVWRRSLAFHLGQAALPVHRWVGATLRCPSI